jgi:hypothetical protein
VLRATDGGTVTRWFATLALLPIAVTTVAQESDRKCAIAVNVISTDWRIQNMLPGLREEAAQAVEQSAKDVCATIVSGYPSTPVEQARQKSADYLLTISLALLSQAPPSQGELGHGPPTTTADVPTGRVPTGLAHSRCEDLLDQAFAFSYKVTSLKGEKIKLEGSHIIGENEYPLNRELNCLSKFSTKAVRDCASEAVKKLKSKKKI